MDASTPGPLIVRLRNWVGEVVLAVPTLRRLADAGYQLYPVGKSWAPKLLESTGWPVRVRPPGLWAAARALRDLRIELDIRAPKALLMTSSASSAIEARLAGTRPYGYARDGRSVLLSAAYPMPRFNHVAQGYWHLASCFLGTDAPYPTRIGLDSSEAQRAEALRVLATHGLVPGSFALLCPFSGSDDVHGRKIWPGFGALATRLAHAGLAVVVCPGPGEEGAASSTLPDAVRLSHVDLGVYGALQRLARIVVANDTGPGHLAAAVGARLVAIYGPHSIAAWAPIGGHVRLFQDTTGWPSVECIARAALESEPGEAMCTAVR